MTERAVEIINMTILSMAVKQQVLDEMRSEIFECNIYREYIDYLIKANLMILGLEDYERIKYLSLIDEYINGEIEEPDDVLLLLKRELYE